METDNIFTLSCRYAEYHMSSFLFSPLNLQVNTTLNRILVCVRGSNTRIKNKTQFGVFFTRAACASEEY